MKRLLILIGVPLFIAFTALGIYNISNQKELNDILDIKLDQREIQIKTLEQKANELKENLENQEGLTEKQQKENEQLQKEIEQLEIDLQAKLDNQKRIAKEREQLEQASNRATGVSTVAASGNCADWIAGAGISDIANASELIRRESNCNPNAVNPSSGACGVAQELPCGKSGCSIGDGACQVKWMAGYVEARYGSWAGAVAFHNANNWY